MKSKIGMMFLVVMLALAGIGISYAGFTDEIYIFGDVNTATVDHLIKDFSYTEVWKVWGTGAPDNEMLVLHYPPPTGQNIDPTDYPNHELVAYSEIDHGTGEYDVEFGFYNVFPLVPMHVDFTFEYTGTIPVKIYELDWNILQETEAWMAYIDITGIMRCNGEVVEEGYQLHTGDEVHVELWIELEQQNELQGKHIEGEAWLKLIQWNEYEEEIPPITEVWVDDDFDSSTPGWQVTHFDVIQDGVDAVTGSTVHVAAGTYNENVQIYNTPVELIGEDKESTIINGGGSTALYVGVDGVRISGFTVTGALSSNQGGIHVSNVDQCDISDVIATNNHIGIYLYGTENSNVVNNICYDNQYYGISLERGIDTVVSDNTLQENKRYDLNVYVHNDDHCNNVIENNLGSGDRPIKFYNTEVHLTSSDGPFSELIICNADSSTIDGVTVDGSDDLKNNGIVLLRTDDAEVTNCVSNQNYYGISLSRNNNNNLIENNQANENYQGIVVNYYSDDNIIRSNTVNSNQNYGIYIYFLCSDTIVSYNAVRDNGDQGIYLYSSDYTIVDQNEATGNEYGLYMSDSEQCTITSNYLASNTKDGLYLMNTNYYNTISDNVMDDNNRYGIYMTNSNTDNTFVRNDLDANSQRGIHIGSSSCSNNLFYDNYLSNSDNYYQDPGATNTWNIDKTLGTNIIGGPYLGGNFWSDYTGYDTDSDGLGDTDLPYGPGDNHPLVMLLT